MRQKKILYFFNHKAELDIEKIHSGKLPTDRLYGLIELRKLGWHVDVCDERISTLEYKCRDYLHLVNFKTLFKAARYDVWLVKDDFSIILTLAAFFMHKQIIYMDSLFRIPRNILRKLFLYINIRLAPRIITYSMYQVELWSNICKLKKDRFTVARYTIDSDFYIKGMQNAATNIKQSEPYILATGRDLGRDYKTLVNAAQRVGINVKLVTLPYLVPNVSNCSNLEIFEYISYSELFNLYHNATIIAVPLKKNIVYPSGIRAVLEAMLIGKPVICTITPILEEYIPKSSLALAYVNAENEEELAKCIMEITQNVNLQKQLVCNAQKIVQQNYTMEIFASFLDRVLTSEQ